MIIKTFELNKLKNKNFNIFLLYGENEGLKNQIVNDYFIKNFEGQIFRYEENEIFTNYDNFLSELLNQSFFEREKIIIITRCSEKIEKFVKEFIEKDILDIKIIIDSKSLDKRSKLRSFFEKEKGLICVPFYQDNEKPLLDLTTNFLNDNKIYLSREVINLIIERCCGDRQNLFNELEKISSFAINRKKLTIEDILILTNLAENYGISELVDNCLSKNVNKTNKILNENNFSSDECILIIRTFLSKTKRLLLLENNYSKNKNLDNVISSFKPPIFWKDKEIVKNQILNWQNKEIEKLLFKIKNVELSLKKNSDIGLYIIYDFILDTVKTNN